MMQGKNFLLCASLSEIWGQMFWRNISYKESPTAPDLLADIFRIHFSPRMNIQHSHEVVCSTGENPLSIWNQRQPYISALEGIVKYISYKGKGVNIWCQAYLDWTELYAQFLYELERKGKFCQQNSSLGIVSLMCSSAAMKILNQPENQKLISKPWIRNDLQNFRFHCGGNNLACNYCHAASYFRLATTEERRCFLVLRQQLLHG